MISTGKELIQKGEQCKSCLDSNRLPDCDSHFSQKLADSALSFCGRQKITSFARRLVGVGDVQPTNSTMMNKVLQLPTDVLGLMRSQFVWENLKPS